MLAGLGTGLGERLGAGRFSEVFVWGPESVVKLFYPGYPPEEIVREMQQARIARDAGLPTPDVLGLVALQGRNGIEFERVHGPTVYDLIRAAAQPMAELARAFFDLQHQTYRIAIRGLEPLGPGLINGVANARGVLWSHRHQAIDVIRTAVCPIPVHGDFHPLNVIMSSSGMVVIDWATAGTCDAALDLTRTMLLLKYSRPEQVERKARSEFLAAYSAYCRLAWSGRMEHLLRWQVPAVLLRLVELESPASPGWAVERALLMKLLNGDQSIWLGGMPDSAA